MPLPHNLKIGDQRQTRDGDTVTFVAYLPKGKVNNRLLWTVDEETPFTTSEQGVYCADHEDAWDIPSLAVERTSPQVGMTIRNLRLSDEVGVIVALTPKLRVVYNDGERDQCWTPDAKVKWPWEDKWQLANHD
jgi:hypothetical protein